MSLIGTFLIISFISSVCIFIFIIPELVGYKCIGLSIGALSCLVYTIFYMKWIGDNCLNTKRGEKK